MSWFGGYKPAHKSTAEEDSREARRKKLDAERLHRAQQRLLRQQQLQAARQGQEEAEKAIQDLLAIDPNLLEANDSDDNVSVTESEAENLLAEMESFEVENGTDGADALSKLGHVKCEFSKEDIEFWFTELETQLEIIEVKSQWTKRIALQRFLPAEIKEEIKTLLKIQKANAGTDIYKRIKTELINLFGSKPEDAYTRAKNRVMTGKPSQLGKKLVDDLCKCDVKLSAGCCAQVIWGMYREAIPVVIRNHIAEMTFDKDTYLQVFKKSDQIFDSNQSTQPVRGTTVASVSAQPTHTDLEVAAMKPQRKPKNQNRNNSGGFKGNAAPAQNSSTNTSNTSNTSKPSTPTAHKGPRHATARGENDKLCKMHYKWGENSAYCAAPWKCPMKNIFKAPQ